ncbi:MAG: hypothetical protein K6F46_09795 [Desulfovibrio sp.]|nr:hypothetical protein [Desulfovibrio sp.]
MSMTETNWLIRPPSIASQNTRAAQRSAARPVGADRDFASLLPMQEVTGDAPSEQPLRRRTDGREIPMARPSSPAAAGSGNTPAQAAVDGQKAGGTADSRKASAQGVADAPAKSPMKAQQSMPRVAPLPMTGANHLVLAGRTPSELMRMQLFNRAQQDLRQTQAMSGLMQSLGGSGSTLDLARSMGAARHLRNVTGNDGQFGALGLGDLPPASCPTRRRAARPKSHAQPSGIGTLCARFESGKEGIAAIGYDGTGGTSYGKYQIASRVGSMKDFLRFLDKEAPDIANRLRKAGPADTGSRRGAMPDEWRAIAKEQPKRFEALQESYIVASHYQPALNSIIERTGLTEDSISPAMREVIWSTAVQHGPAGAARIFARADKASGKPTDLAYERRLINNVYEIRSGQFGSSTSAVRRAVQNRFREEKAIALAMLDGNPNRNIA